MMTPILYGSIEIVLKSRTGDVYVDEEGNVFTKREERLDFDTLGVGVLADTMDCVVTEVRNGQFELEMTYPVSGEHYDNITVSSYVLAEPAVDTTPQFFEIYRISKPINGRVRIYGRHGSYRLSYDTVMPFTATSVTAEQAMNLLKENSVEDCQFTFWSDFTGTTEEFKIGEPLSLRSCLGGVRGSILDHWSGEFEWDNFEVKLHKERGTNNGVELIYGKNITDLNQDENIENTVTGLVPYWKGYDENNEEVVVTCGPVYAENAGNFPYSRTVPHDFSVDFTYPPTPELLKTTTENYIKNNKVGIPDIDLEVSFVNLSDTTEYADIKVLETVHLCDTVTVSFPKLGVESTSKVTKTVYDVLKGRYKSVTLGESSTTNLNATIQAVAAQPIAEATASVQSQMAGAVTRATESIRGANGGYFIINDTNHDGQNDEILFLDETSGGNISQAVNVWRWNNGGLGFSSHGYNGPYETAITASGEIVANFITVGELTANLIKTGLLSSSNGKFSLNMETGAAVLSSLTATGGTVGGFTIDSSSIRNGELSSTAAGAVALSINNFIRAINGTSRSNLRFAIGSKFAVADDGSLYASGANISGAITATSLDVTNANITGTISGSAIQGAVQSAINATNATNATNAANATTSSSCTGNASTATNAQTNNFNIGAANVYTDGSTYIRISLSNGNFRFYPLGRSIGDGLSAYFTVDCANGEIALCADNSGNVALRYIS